MIAVRCGCGETLHAAEEHAGRRVRCRCGRVVEVRRSAARRARKRAPLYTAPATAPRRPQSRWRARASAAMAKGGLTPRRLVTWLSWGYLAGAVLVAAVLWGLGERWWPANIFLFGPRWLLLLPLLVLLPAAALVRPRMLAPLLAGTVVVLGPVMGLRVAWRWWERGAAGAPAVRVVTINVEAGEILAARLPDLLDEWRPDVIALQECGPDLERAMRELPRWFHHAEQGLCLLSRHPITDTAVMDRSGLADVEDSGLGGSTVVVTYTIAAPHGPVRLTNVHLETPRKGFYSLRQYDVRGWRTAVMLREVESRRARAWVDRTGASALVVGDFNLPVESSIFRASWGDFRDAFSEAGTGFGMTKYNGWIRARIDHVLLGRGWRPVRAFVGPDVGSDHRPVIADLRWVGS